MDKHEKFWIILVLLLTAMAACQPTARTPTLSFTPTLSQTSTPTPTATSVPVMQPIFQTFALGQIWPDMRVPIQRGGAGEGGWYVIIGSREGWAQFLSQMGQPATIWQPVDWEREILVGALLGLRQGRERQIEMTDLVIGGVEVLITVDLSAPVTGRRGDSGNQLTYPFHLVRVPRIELPLGPSTWRFLDIGGNELAAQNIEVGDVDLIWLTGAPAVLPTSTPVQASSLPLPTATTTPVPNLRVRCIVLGVLPEARMVQVVAESGGWQNVYLTEGTSILREGQTISLAQLQPGMTVGVLGYAEEWPNVRAMHIDLLKPAAQTGEWAAFSVHTTTLSTIYDGYNLPLSLDAIRAPTTLTGLLTISQTQVLTTNGFVIRPAGYQSFAELYADPRYADYVPFISTDSVLHVSHMLFAHTRRTVERDHLLIELKRLNREMFELAWAQYRAGQSFKSLAAQAVARAAWQNAARFAVSSALLDDEFVPPDVLSQTVAAELALIRAAEGITVSALSEGVLLDSEKLYIDYSRFALQGQDEAQTRYAQAIVWHEQAGWRLQWSEEALAIALLAHSLEQNSVSRMLLDRLLSARRFWDGYSSTLTVADILTAYRQVWGNTVELFDLANPARLDNFVRAATGVVLPSYLDQRTSDTLTWLGTPLSLDEAVGMEIAGSERLTDTVGLSAMYMAAVLDAPEAYVVLDEAENNVPLEVLDHLNTLLDVPNPSGGMVTADRIEWDLYRAMFRDKSVAFPAWMRTRAWRRKELQTAFGGWVDGQRLLMPTAIVRAEAWPSPTGQWGYVEPQPQVYGQLAAWTQMLIDGLQSRLMLSEDNLGVLSEWQSWLTTFQDLARRELTGQTITDLEVQRLTGYADVIARLTRHALSGVPEDADAAVTYDMATFTKLGRGRVSAMGRVDEIYVVVERGAQRFLTRGGVYSFYEFDYPDDKFDAQLWIRLLAQKGVSRPAWLNELVVP